jgi:hypothetical protein
MSTADMKDLIVLTADTDMKVTVDTLLNNPHKLGTHAITFDSYKHPQRDNGCYKEAENFLRPFTQQYRHALVLFDYHGSGVQAGTALDDVYRELDERFARNGWPDNRAAAVVLYPELESWVWSTSPEIATCLGWEDDAALRTWLRDKGFLTDDAPKPDDPKQAMEQSLRMVRKRHSPAIFRKLAETVSIKRCEDTSFQRFLEIVRLWFPAN